MSHRPNIVYILADDMGYGDVSCLNASSKIQTTHLDQMASEGLICTDGHSSSSVCTPSRYSILTGRYNWRSWLKHGVTYGYSKAVIEQDRLTVPGMLSQQGYHSACIGKWHLGWEWSKAGEAEDQVDFSAPIKQGPCDRGFDYFYGISASLDMPPYVYVENDRATALPEGDFEGKEGLEYMRAGKIAADFIPEDVLPNLTRRAKAYIKDQAHAEQPFFLYFSLPAPHTPILPVAEFQGKSGLTPYADFCLMVDDVVGQVMQTLEEQGIAEDTILIFTADNGCSPAADIPLLQSLGHEPSYHFRGHKADIYEGGHRVPYLIRWPEAIAQGSVTDQTVCLVDLMSTCAEIIGVDLPDEAAEDSVSNLSIWQGRSLETSLREATVHHSIDGSFSIRKGSWKLELCPGSGGWSFPRPGEEGGNAAPVQLYDLSKDIGEQFNIQAEHPALVSSLKAELTDYIQRGRSTPGSSQENYGGELWEQLWWMHEANS